MTISLGTSQHYVIEGLEDHHGFLLAVPLLVQPDDVLAIKPAAANPGWRIQFCREPGWFSDVILSGVAEPER